MLAVYECEKYDTRLLCLKASENCLRRGCPYLVKHTSPDRFRLRPLSSKSLWYVRKPKVVLMHEH